jgi:hypothetical protein
VRATQHDALALWPIEYLIPPAPQPCSTVERPDPSLIPQGAAGNLRVVQVMDEEREDRLKILGVELAD